MSHALARKICIAPMIDWTDRHYRYMMRLITKRTILYTEMITTNAIIHGSREHLLQYSPQENPLTLQLGGNNPKDLAFCAKLAKELGFSEINLNVGCPSDRVSQGEFGLSLMYKPQLVKECVVALKTAVNIPVSVKCRIGVDDKDSFDELIYFIQSIVDAKVDFICIHARKGWLKGLSPKENRTIPPLKYDTVYRIKQLFPNNQIGINGGITNFNEAKTHLEKVDSVMIGREAYHNPMLFKDVDHFFYNEKLRHITPFDVAENLIQYIENELKTPGTKLNHITRHTLNLFNGYPNARLYRRFLSENATRYDANVNVFEKALKTLRS
ncbi:tRNA dihydrouridine(20/20a) synthase DusA [Fastidiosibacter lacustris]|uniref:tRNA dihydrouridine(20/20a) synthase DusA n=1 Tax=Fastidiosibacter lacustris TaxID=2056695 RepID=UPI000E3489F9|nr:tRNA dihydrouridine(20/20a) synthase DusA [Fastidiosibacter lacustris]